MKQRYKAASRAAAIHLSCGVLLAGLLSLLIFLVWFPYPYREISGAKNLFVILVAVDVVCGPLLTLLLFDSAKERWKWRIDLVMILSLQLGALVYGLNNVAQSRPVFLAYEGDRFRVVRVADLDGHQLKNAAPEFSSLSWTGPKLMAAKLLKPTDPGYVDSIKQALDGEPPAFRPERWVPYAAQKEALLESLKPMSALRGLQEKDYSLPALEKETGLNASSLGYLPLVQDELTDWIVIVDRSTGMPKAYWHVDGW